MFPHGTVIRRKIMSEEAPTRVLMKKILPFLLLGLPLFFVRSKFDYSNGYVETTRAPRRRL